MKVIKRLLCPRRRRRVPSRFSWIDHRLVGDRHIEKCASAALALYLFLVTVSDSDGLSYYSDRSICRKLSLDAGQLAGARDQLLQAGLIAYEKPLYQVLSLEPERPAPAAPPGRKGQCQSLGDILKEAVEAGGRR